MRKPLFALGGLALGACLGDLEFVRAAGAYCDDLTPCVSGNYCDLERFVCAPKLEDGADCQLADACAEDPTGPLCPCRSGFCADGVCCATACTDDCTECDRLGEEGRCLAAAPGTDPDDDCPGSTSCSEAGSCQGSLVWSVALGESGRHEIHDVAIGPDGEVVAVGTSQGQLTAGSLSVQVDGEADALIVKLDATGSVVCAAVFGDLAAQEAAAVAVAGDGTIVVAGSFEAEMLVGSNLLVAPAGAPDMFVLALDGGCEPLWAVRLGEPTGPPTAQRAHDLAIDGGVVVVGEVAESVRFAGATLVARGIDAFVGRLGLDGAQLEAVLYGDADALAAEPQRFTAVTAGTSLVVGGEGRGSFALDVVLAATDDDDVYVAWLDPDLGAASSRHYAGAGDEHLRALAARDTDPCAGGGDLWAGGRFTGELVTGDRDNLGATGAADGWLARLEGDGSTAVARGLGGPEEQETSAIAALAGGAFVGGSFLGELTADGVTIEGRGRDGWVARTACDGAVAWAVPIGGLVDDAIEAIAAGDDGVVVGGWFEHEIVLGEVTHAAPGYRAALVAKLRP
jgi:hypothetical protein